MEDNRETIAKNPDHEISDGDESTSSCAIDENNLSLCDEFEEILRASEMVRQERDEILENYLEYVQETSTMYQQWQLCVQECNKLNTILDEKVNIISDTNILLDKAQKLLNEERKKSCAIEDQRNFLVCIINIVITCTFLIIQNN